MIALGWALIALCGLGMVASVLAWALTERQAVQWDAMRQEVREALVVNYEWHEAVLSSIVICEVHNTVSPDYCAICKTEEFVALTQPGHVVHSP